MEIMHWLRHCIRKPSPWTLSVTCYTRTDQPPDSKWDYSRSRCRMPSELPNWVRNGRRYAFFRVYLYQFRICNDRFSGVLPARGSAAMPRTSRGGTRCLQHGISSRRVQSSIIIRLSRSVSEVSAATDLGADIPTVACDETRRVPVRRHIRGRSRTARGWTIQGGRWRVGGRAHHRFVQFEIEGFRILRFIQRVLGTEFPGQSYQLHAAGSG